MTPKAQKLHRVGRNRRPDILAASVLALLAAGTVSASAQNLVVNGGFETGDLTGWTPFGGPNGVIATSGFPFSGTDYAFFLSVGSPVGISQNIPTVSGDIYTLNFYSYDASTPSSFSVTAGGSTVFSQINTEDPNYTQQTVSFTASSNSTALVYTLDVNSSGGLLLDDVSVTLPLTSTFWLGETSSTWTSPNWSAASSVVPITSLPNANTDVIFSATGARNLNTTLGANFTIHSLMIDNPAPVTINSGGAYTLTIAGYPSTGITIDSGAGLFTLKAGLTLAGFSDTITVNNSAGAVINGVISGSNGLNKDGAGTLVLGAVNNYTGATGINGGILQVGSATNASSLGVNSVVTVANGAVLSLVNVSGNTFANNVTDTTVNEDGTLAINSANTITLSGTLTDDITGPLALTQSGAKTAILTNAGNTYAGATTVNNGILQIGTATLPGSIGAGSAVNVGTGGTLMLVNATGSTLANNITNGLGGVGTLNINSAQSNTLSGTLSDGAGKLALTQSGTGTTTLSGTETYTGATTVNAGTLLVEGSLGNTAIAVNKGGTLGGIGPIAGLVTVNSGGTLTHSGTSNLPGTITLGGLTLNSGSIVDYELGSPGLGGAATCDLTQVNGNLTLGGSLDIAGLVGFGAGAYELFSYTGKLVGSTMAIGTLPAGFTASNFKIQTSIANQVDLIVTGGPLVQYWNGPVVTPNGAINGGSATWDNTTTNWTNAAGATSASWGKSVAVFSTGAGTVTVGSSITATAVGFGGNAGGYTLSVSPSQQLSMTGAGVLNSSSTTQNFVTTVDGTGNVGTIQFLNSASAGHGTQFTNTGASISTAAGGSTNFHNTSTAGSATFINNGAQVGGGTAPTGGFTEFFDTASAGSATLNNIGGAVVGATGGYTWFVSKSTAGSATINNDGATGGFAVGGSTQFSGTATAGSATINNNPLNTLAIGGAGKTTFNDSATAGSAAISNNAGILTDALGGTTYFDGSSTAGNASITNQGTAVAGATGGQTQFTNTSSAGSATIVSNGGSNGGPGGSTYFVGSADGGTAVAMTNGNAIFDISGLADGGMKIGAIEGAGTYNLGHNTLTVGGNNLTTTVAGTISDGGMFGGMGGSLTKVGTGVLTLTGSNPFTGPTLVEAGILQIGNGISGSLADSNITVSGTAGLVTNLPNNTVVTQNIALSSTGATLKAIQSSINLFSGVISGTGVFDQNGSGITILYNNNTFSGPTNVNAGTLVIGDGAAGNLAATTTVTVSGFGSVILNLAPGATFPAAVKLAAPAAVLATSQTGTTTVSNVISGTGFFEENGGTTIFTNTESYTGPTIVDFGTLEVDGSIAAGSALSVATDGTLTGKGTIHGSATLTGSGIIDFSTGGDIAGTLGVTGGNWNGVGTVTGLITSSSGTFTIGGTLTAPAGLAVTGGTVAGSGTLAGSLNYTSSLSATLGITISGASSTLIMNSPTFTLTLNASETYTGATTVTAGTLQVGDGTTGSLAVASAVTIANNATLTLDLPAGRVFSNKVTDNGHVLIENGSILSTTTISGLISGTGSLTKVGSGNVSLTGANTYSGGTAINSGALLVGNTTGSATGAGPVNANSGGTLGGAGKISGPVTLNSGGEIAPGVASAGTAGTTLHAASLLWNGGSTIALQLGATGDELVLTGALTKGSAGAFTLDLANAGITKTSYTLATFASTTFTPSTNSTQFTLELPVNYTGTLVVTSTSLEIENLVDPPSQGSESVGDPPAPQDPGLPLPGAADYAQSDPSNLDLTPITPTPEPGSAVLLAFGAGTLLGYRRRRRAAAGASLAHNLDTVRASISRG